MPTFITGGPARVTITPLGPAGPVGGLVIVALAVGLAGHYARTLTEAVTISLWVLFSVTLAAVVTGIVLLARRIRAELRRTAAAVDSPAVDSPAVEQGSTAAGLRSGAAPAIAPPAVDVDVKPEWIIPREARP